MNRLEKLRRRGDRHIAYVAEGWVEYEHLGTRRKGKTRTSGVMLRRWRARAPVRRDAEL